MKALKSIGTKFEAIGTAGSRVINNMRGIEETIDPKFEAERRNLENHFKNIEQMLENLREHVKFLNGMQESLRQFAIHASRFSSNEQRISGCPDFVETCDLLKKSGDVYREQATQVEHDLKNLLSSLSIMKREVIERDRLLLDYDRLRFELHSVERKPPEQVKPEYRQVLHQRCEVARQLYEKRNNELLAQISDLYFRRNIHTEVQMLVMHLATYFGSSSQKFSALSTSLAQKQPNVVPAKSTSGNSSLSHSAPSFPSNIPAQPARPNVPQAPASTPAPTSTAVSSMNPSRPFSPPGSRNEPILKPTGGLQPANSPPIQQPVILPTVIGPLSTAPIDVKFSSPAPNTTPTTFASQLTVQSNTSQPSSTTTTTTSRSLQAEALFDFVPEEDTELAFSAGDIITILSRDNPDWWEGQLNGRVGEVPAPYLRLLE